MLAFSHAERPSEPASAGPADGRIATVEQEAGGVTVRAASELTGGACGTIRQAVRRGNIRRVGVIEGGPYARDRWLLDYSSVMSWDRASGLPARSGPTRSGSPSTARSRSPSTGPSRSRPSDASKPSGPV